MERAGELVLSLGGEVDGHDVFVSLFSVMNAVGRLAFGYFPERCLHTFGVPRCAAGLPGGPRGLPAQGWNPQKASKSPDDLQNAPATSDSPCSSHADVQACIPRHLCRVHDHAGDTPAGLASVCLNRHWSLHRLFGLTLD